MRRRVFGRQRIKARLRYSIVFCFSISSSPVPARGVWMYSLGSDPFNQTRQTGKILTANQIVGHWEVKDETSITCVANHSHACNDIRNLWKCAEDSYH